LHAFANSRGHVPQCPMIDDATEEVAYGLSSVLKSVNLSDLEWPNGR